MSNPRIAVIEDEASILKMYQMKLEASGFDVAAAENGLEGLEVIKNFKPDLVLLDLRMPVMDGQEMLRKLREKDWGNNILVIILTNISQNEASLDMRFLRVDKYIVKAHSTPSQVVAEVKSSLIRHGLIDRLAG